MAAMWEQYRVPSHGYDETRDDQGAIRPCWARLMAEIARMDETDLSRLQATANRHIREHGATFYLHSEQQNGVRPWRLDPIPLVIDHDEWQIIDAGLRQRVKLLSMVYADLYGPRELIRSGLIPLDLVLRHPGFQRPCSGALRPDAVTLFHYAADLARGPDGRMWVIKDRAGTPPGAGYALENRTIMGRLLPEEIHRLQVHRLSDSFRAMRAGLNAIAPVGTTPPRIALYTPGPYSPSYFEHAFLASYLGYTLVQGDDLMVRDGRLWLKALEGLQPVDVLIRRVSDAFCDPLELHEQSQLGVAGLLEAVRRRTVTVANAIGSSVLENPGLMPFLPGLSRVLLGEPLLLPTAATWWCGQTEERQYVLDHIDTLIVKSIDQGRVLNPGRVDEGPPVPPPALASAIQREPWRYIGQERVSFSTMPVLEGGRLEPRAMTLRVFVTYDGASHLTMPGGLTRCGAPGQTYLASRVLGGICKDTWIMTPEPVAYRSLWLERPEEDRQGPFSGLFTSSAAENLFWTGRYAERAGRLLQTVRVLLRAGEQHLPSVAEPRDECVERLWRGLQLQCGISEDALTSVGGAAAPIAERVRPVVTDASLTGSLPFALRGFISAAFSVRENWSTDTWRIINRAQELTDKTIRGKGRYHRDVAEWLDGHLLLLQAFFGQCFESMTRTPGWLFLSIGRRLESGMMMIDLLRGALDGTPEEWEEYALLEALLEINESLITYRRAYRTTPERGHVLKLLLTQPKNPRSLVFLLQQIESLLQSLAGEIENPATPELGLAVAECSSRLLGLTPAEFGHVDAKTGRLAVMSGVLEPIRHTLSRTGESLSHACFKHAPSRPHPLTAIRQPAAGALA